MQGLRFGRATNPAACHPGMSAFILPRYPQELSLGSCAACLGTSPLLLAESFVSFDEPTAERRLFLEVWPSRFG